MNMEEMDKDYYQRLRLKINSWIDENVGKEHKWSEYILLAPDIFHLLIKLSIDPEVPKNKKIKIAAAIAYFISPLDFIPEIILGPIGYLDDISLAAFVLNDIINDVDPQIIRRNWAGDKDILSLIKTIMANANEMLGSGLWQRLKKRFSKM